MARSIIKTGHVSSHVKEDARRLFEDKARTAVENGADPAKIAAIRQAEYPRP